ncbi:MAG: hypothetical protein ACKPKO_06025 [Candidatus Fonsibacter sp.]
MMKYDHIYTLNHNINILKQQTANHRPDNEDNDDEENDDEDKDNILIKPSPNYRVEEDRDPNYYTMIHHIDDLPNLIDCFLVYKFVLMLKEVFEDGTAFVNMKKENIMNLIYNSDYLNILFSNLKPQVMNNQ